MASVYKFSLVLYLFYHFRQSLGGFCWGERSQEGFALLNSTYAIHLTKGYSDCVELCFENPDCRSLNYWWATRRCDLNRQSKRICPVCYISETGSTYMGVTGEKEIPKSCSDLKKMNPATVSGDYVIDPDGEGGVTEFTVTCDMIDKGGVGVTIIGHDSESRTLVNGSESPGSYVRDIRYNGASLSQMESLTRVSVHCEQFIKYECFGSVFVYDNERYNWWVSRDGNDMNYWGGAAPGSGKCACGMTNSCASPNLGCNCDVNDWLLREDSGFLSDKSRLPVIQLRFGDTGNKKEYGFYTLEKLKCLGLV